MRDRIMLGASVLGFLSLCWVCLARNGGLLAAAASASSEAGPLSSLSLTWAGGQVTIAGVVPDSAVKAQLQARVESLSREASIANSIETGNTVAPGDWLVPVLDSISVARPRLDAGELTVIDRGVTLSGEVADEGERNAIVAALRDAAGPGFSVTSRLEVSTKAAARREAVALRERLAEPLRFSRGSATIDDTTQSLLEDVAKAMIAHEDLRLLIRTPSSTGGGRRRSSLVENRARAARTQLVSLGVRADRMDIGAADAAAGETTASPDPRGTELVATVGEDPR